MTDQEASAVIEAFVLPDRQERYLALLQSERGRAKARAALAHFRDLDPRRTQPIPPQDQTVERLTSTLHRKGAPSDCYLFAEDPALDNRRMPLEQGLRAVIGRGMGAFVSCVPGRLAYFEGEEAHERYICERNV